MSSKPSLRMVYVRWKDSAGDNGEWKMMDSFAVQCDEVLICETAGFVVIENEKIIKLGFNIGGYKNKHLREQCNGLMTIPKCSILEIKDLK